MNKYLKELITQRALTFKLEGWQSPHQAEFMESLIEKDPKSAEIFKNVCAPLPVDLAKRLEDTIGLLGLTKRQFLTNAVSSALDDADLIMKELDIFEYENEYQENLKKLQEEKAVQ